VNTQPYKKKKKEEEGNFRDKNIGQTKKPNPILFIKKGYSGCPRPWPKTSQQSGAPSLLIYFFSSQASSQSPLFWPKARESPDTTSLPPLLANKRQPLILSSSSTEPRLFPHLSQTDSAAPVSHLTLKQPLHHRPSPFSAGQTNPQPLSHDLPLPLTGADSFGLHRNQRSSPHFNRSSSLSVSSTVTATDKQQQGQPPLFLSPAAMPLSK
jgi:hypothetical protein